MVDFKRTLRKHTGKTNRAKLIENKKYLSVLDHMNDVRIVGEFLWDNVYASFITEEIATYKSLFLFACLVHDIGKFSQRFQHYILDDNEDSSNKPNHVDATHNMLIQVFCKDQRVAYSCLADVVGYHHGYMKTTSSKIFDGKWESWTQKEFEALKAYIQHYLDELNLTVDDVLNPTIKVGYKHFVPFHIRDILSGMLIEADWIGSNTQLFPLWNEQKSFNKKEAKARNDYAIKKLHNLFQTNIVLNTDMPSGEAFYKAIYGESFCPTPLQEVVMSDALDVNKYRMMVIVAPCGTGKTESAFALAYRYKLAMNNPKCAGIYYALPTCATSNPIYERLLTFLQSVLRHKDGTRLNPDEIKVLLHHSKAPIYLYDKNNKGVEDERELMDSCDTETDNGEWEKVFRGKLSLATRDLVGTVDHILKVCMCTKHFTMLHANIANHIVVFDEVHSYDEIMFKSLVESVKILSMFNVPIIVMSATLPDDKREELMRAYGIEKARCLDVYPDPETSGAEN